MMLQYDVLSCVCFCVMRISISMEQCWVFAEFCFDSFLVAMAGKSGQNYGNVGSFLMMLYA